MTIADMIGQVDIFSAAVAIGFMGGVTIMATTALARQPRKKMEFEYRLADMKQHQEHESDLKRIDVERETALGKIAANKQVEITRIENGMLDVKTSSQTTRDDY